MVAFNYVADANVTMPAGFTQWTSNVDLLGTQNLTIGSNVVSVTPYLDARDPNSGIVTPRIAERNRSTADAGYPSVNPDLLYQFWRSEISTTYNNSSNSWPALKIQVTGLQASTAYQLTIGSFDKSSAYLGKYQDSGLVAHPLKNILQPDAGTTGATSNWTFTGVATADGLVSPGGAGTDTAADTFTTDASGVLTVDWILDNTNNNAGANPEAVMNFLTVTPEPATLALLVLGGLAALRRRR
jgi:hypothetical protein